MDKRNITYNTQINVGSLLFFLKKIKKGKIVIEGKNNITNWFISLKELKDVIKKDESVKILTEGP